MNIEINQTQPHQSTHPHSHHKNVAEEKEKLYYSHEQNELEIFFLLQRFLLCFSCQILIVCFFFLMFNFIILPTNFPNLEKNNNFLFLFFYFFVILFSYKIKWKNIQHNLQQIF